MDDQASQILTAMGAIMTAVDGEVATATIVAEELVDAPSREEILKGRDKLLGHMRRVNAYADELDAFNTGVNTDKIRKSIVDLVAFVDKEIK